MLHPTLALAIGTAHIEDLQREGQRAGACRRTVRLGRHVGHEPGVATTSGVGRRPALTQPYRLRAPKPTPMTRTESLQAAPTAMPPGPELRSGAMGRDRSGIE